MNIEEQIKEMTVADAERWIEKFELLSSKGAKLIMIKNLLTQQREEAIRGFAKHIEDLVKEGRVLALVGEMPTGIAETFLKERNKE